MVSKRWLLVQGLLISKLCLCHILFIFTYYTIMLYWLILISWYLKKKNYIYSQFVNNSLHFHFWTGKMAEESSLNSSDGGPTKSYSPGFGMRTVIKAIKLKYSSIMNVATEDLAGWLSAPSERAVVLLVIMVF